MHGCAARRSVLWGPARQVRGAGASEMACRTVLGMGFHGVQGALADAGPRSQAAYQAAMLVLQQARPALQLVRRPTLPPCAGHPPPARREAGA
jgi:hypothetical protein